MKSNATEPKVQYKIVSIQDGEKVIVDIRKMPV